MVTTPNYNLDSDSTLGGNNASDYIIPSQKAVKGYVDSQTGTAPAFANLTGSPYDNTNLADALNDKYNASNPDGYITGITSSDVTTALGYTPYNSSNPNGYQANEIETIKVNGTAQTITSKAVDISVPTNNNQLTNGAGYITSSALSGYATETYVDTELANKQDSLVSGTNIKTINSTSILGSGNISVATSAQGALADTALQPNDNISELTNNAGYITSSALAPYALSADLATVATSGSYNDLSDKPTIPAAQVNSDWNASSGVAQILNKPTLATVATSGSYNDLSNKPTIPSEVTESTVSGWGFTKNAGTVTSVNNVSPVNGNVTLTIPDTSNLANKDLSNLSSTGESKFQVPLVSGTNIKTVNGNSLLGSGDITIQSGASYSATCPAITPVDGVATWSVTHNLDTQAVVTALYSNGNKVEHNTLVTSNNAITVTFKASSAVTAGSYKIVVLASGGSGGGSADDTYTSNVKNYTVVGTITENDGFLSGFTRNTNYAYSSSTIPLGTDFEFYTKFTATSAFSAQHNIASSRNNTVFAVMVTSNGKMQVNCGTTAGWGPSLMGHTTLSANTTYYVKVVYKNNTYSFYISTDGINYTQEATGAYTETMPDITLNIGMGRSNTAPFNGSIDAKETYFVVNGVEVWRAIDNNILTNLSPVTDYYVNGSSWYKETFSDATRTKRIWLEQGGVASSSTATINLLKSFSNTNYVVTGGASNKTTSSFTLTSNANWVAIGV